MKAATLSEIKNELKTLPPKQWQELCLHLAKFKKDNKELLTYLLFEAHDESSYIKSIKEEMDELFAEVNRYNLYQAKKTLRKILKNVSKYIKYSGKKETEVDLLLYYCKKMKASGIRYQSSPSLDTLFQRQLFKIGKAIGTLHEDLQYDFVEELKLLK